MNNIRVQFKEFDGPLDLLLSLVDEKKMEITEVSISSVTEPFLGYLDTLEEKDAQELADFLVVAAKLLLMKSRTLLPQFAPEEDDGISLEDQLRLYRRFVDVSKKVNTLWLDDSKKSYGRVEPPVRSDEVIKPENMSQDTMHASMVQLVKRLAPPKPLPETQIDKTVSMKEKIDTLHKLLKKGKEVSFQTLLSDASTKTEVIVSFLAILELVKQKDIYLQQDNHFSDIVIAST
ncbi:hypothetical protein C0581_04280 [Candidatus Parcubacteria bacterium]|mgnify:CR=1 FL=1|nr:MAG: hypothetical protein C0581_04280 [Candidatus Parcubacteria bacterium]